ncbi:uncharacterized mitochondrial protein-like protein [Tanacetum coccineum]|uniref:Uncharacterized mitochondrial protein-like protein n=1 Tax=Tanacetum coccineum TaxID=301880 RepID=A0ABQ5HJN9_9ASTR
MGLWYSKYSCITLTAYADADHTGCQDTRRSTSGSAQFLGDKILNWSSKKQKSTVISSIEAEYIALSGCSSGKWSGGIVLHQNRIAASRHLYQSFATRKIQLLDRKAWTEKHVSRDFEKSG